MEFEPNEFRTYELDPSQFSPEVIAIVGFCAENEDPVKTRSDMPRLIEGLARMAPSNPVVRAVLGKKLEAYSSLRPFDVTRGRLVVTINGGLLKVLDRAYEEASRSAAVSGGTPRVTCAHLALALAADATHKLRPYDEAIAEAAQLCADSSGTPARWNSMVDYSRQVLDDEKNGKFRDFAADPPLRHSQISSFDADRAVAAFEAPLRVLERLSLDGLLHPRDEDYYRNTLQQLNLWRQCEGADPQIFELHVAGLVRRFLQRLTDTSLMQEEFVRLGAEAEVAQLVSERFAKIITDMASLGSTDAADGAEKLRQIAEEAEEVGALLEAVPDVREAAREGLTRAAGWHRQVPSELRPISSRTTGRRFRSGSSWRPER
jgi:hypothetical protein